LRYGIILTVGDPATVADLAALAESAGWDGVFSWDGVAIGDGDTYDPWVVMAAIAMRTRRVTIGAIVTPPARRRPWKLARETMTLDRLSGGRLVLPVGLGALDDGAFGNVGEPTGARTRAELLDESLAILEGLWSGRPFAFEGRHFRFGPMTFRPTPVQQPRIPVWVVGAWPRERSMRRAVRWDGIVVQAQDDAGAAIEAEPDVVRSVVEYAARERRAAGERRPLEVVVSGSTPASEPDAAAALVRPLAEAGATWWIEADWTSGSVDALRERIVAGPPRVSGAAAAREPDSGDCPSSGLARPQAATVESRPCTESDATGA
jgi:alkanesulfonate monooxygenase SsuD/methylene tetrahydromethanopterin reductase-like flavin-dependent oxidoreductase (luciferase family)